MTETRAAEPESEQTSTRRAFVGAWVSTSAQRSPTDRKCLAHQVNAWSLDLSKPSWVARRYGVAATTCAGAPPALELAGWRRVAELYRDFADPLARYVVAYYYQTWALRPAGIPHRLRDPFREQARSTACTAVHHRLLRGSAQEPGVLEAEPIALSFVSDIAADTVKHRGAHRKSAMLAFADGVLDQVRMLDRDHVALAGRCGLPLDAVAPLLDRLVDTADRLLAEYGDDLPTEPAAAARADELLRFADTDNQDVATEIRQYTRAGRHAPEHLERRSEHLGEARERTHRALTRSIRRGCAMTDDDARRMFYARLGWLTRRGGGHVTPSADIAEIQAQNTDDTAAHELLAELRESLTRHRAEAPLGLGRAAEYDLSLRLLGLPPLEAMLLIDDVELLTRWCAEAWAHGRPEHAMAMDPIAATDLVLHIMRWAAERAGYRP
ncbi:hypothetical protein [Nocardia sp. NPDC046763]|uniref:hypothetical protein n=1 Tax=Nocardia sp. NPDC046763 TaxID=3155256 RepID=UPI0033DC5D5A